MKTTILSSSSKLDLRQTERAISLLKARFPYHLSRLLHLSSVVAPIFVPRGTGLQDDLNGVERPLSFPGPDGRTLEIVHSLAKWKRHRLHERAIPQGEGIITDMRAIRRDEVPGPLHSIYVDQWDWEKHISSTERRLDYLKATVRKIYEALLSTEADLHRQFPELVPRLPEKVTFLHSEDLQREFPEASPKQREKEAARRYGAVFLIGIGGELPDGTIHDGRAPDYDDWSTPTSEKHRGLNGDLVLWHPELEIPFELSSMGIRVDALALARQLAIRSCEERKEYDFHQKLLQGELPQSIGGGIGQSRLCMFLLRKRHIGEVQASEWPELERVRCREQGISLL